MLLSFLVQKKESGQRSGFHDLGIAPHPLNQAAQARNLFAPELKLVDTLFF